MKFLVGIALFVCLGAAVRSEDVCHNNVVSACSSSALTAIAGIFASQRSSICNARYGGIDNIESDVQAYINHQLTKSYQYLLLATHFNSYQKNRPGFQKLYQGLSDRSYDDTVDLIKQITRRGGRVDFGARHEDPNTVSKRQLKLEVDELHSLAIALDNEKDLAKSAIHVHTMAAHTAHRDPEMAHYLEEKFLGKQSESVRQLSGYANDLSKLMNQQDPSLAVYLFDEYLQKQ